MKLVFSVKFLFILLAYNAKFNPICATRDRIEETKKNNISSFSFLCQDQMVKVESKIYHLDRFRSSLKSVYFEKLFTSDDFEAKNNLVMEIQPVNSEVFPAIVDLIDGKKLADILNKDTYLPLLGAMDHLGMEIDLKKFSSFVDYNLTSYSLQEAKILQLYNFIRKNPKFEYLLKSVFKYLSNNLTILQNHEIFASFPRNHLIRLVESIPTPDNEKRYKIIQLCTKWLCHDLENRLPHIVILINSIKPEFHAGADSSKINDGVRKRLPKINVDEQAKIQIIQSCIFALLAHGGKLNPSILSVEDSFDERYSGYDSDREWALEAFKEEYEEYKPVDRSSSYINYNQEYNKLKKFLKNGDLYDITVRVGEKTYKLHRAILESMSGYFRDIFRAEYAEAAAQCHGIPMCPSKDKEYLMNDEVDTSSFDSIIDYIYLGIYCNGAWTKPDFTAGIFKTSDILKIDGRLTEDCESRLNKYHAKVSLQEVVGILNHTYGKIKYNSLYSLFLTRYLREKWPEINNTSQFYSTPWSMLENILKSPGFYSDDPHKTLEICSKWISHDVGNRFCLLPEIARAINPHCVINDDKFKNEVAADLNKYSSKMVGDKLWEMLSSASLMDAPKSNQTRPRRN